MGFGLYQNLVSATKSGAIHVYNNKERFIEEIKFEFSGDFPGLDQIEDLVNEYCNQRQI